jgi:hypothetical protein
MADRTPDLLEVSRCLRQYWRARFSITAASPHSGEM